MKNDDKDLIDMIYRRNQAQKILADNEYNYEKGLKSNYSDEEIERAQNESKVAKESINNLYNKRIFPYTNSILYVIYYVVSLAILPLVYNEYDYIIPFIFYLLLIVIVFVSRIIEKKCRKNIKKEIYIINCLINFSDQTGIFCYLLTSIGYLVKWFSLPLFYGTYLIMWSIFIIAMIFIVIKPCIIRKKYGTEML